MIVFKYENSLVGKARLHSTAKKLSKEIESIKNASYDTDYASVCLPSDKHMLKVVEAAVRLKKRLVPKLIVVVGIGGSNLGTIAVQEAILGKQYNLHNSLRILYADTVDPDNLRVIITEMQYYLRQGKQVILNAVSKSGGTTETIANFEVLLNVLKRHRKNAHAYCWCYSCIYPFTFNVKLFTYTFSHQLSVPFTNTF